MALVYNGNTVQAIIFNGQTVKRAEFNGNVVFTSEITVTVGIDYYGNNNTFTATLTEPQALGENDSIKITVGFSAGTGGPSYNYYLTKANPTITVSKSGMSAVNCNVFNASGTKIGTCLFSPYDLSATFTSSLYD